MLTIKKAGAARSSSIGTADLLYSVITNNTAALLVQLDDLALAGRVFNESYDHRERGLGVVSPEVLTALLNFNCVFERQEDSKNAAPFVRGAALVKHTMALPHIDVER